PRRLVPAFLPRKKGFAAAEPGHGVSRRFRKGPEESAREHKRGPVAQGRRATVRRRMALLGGPSDAHARQWRDCRENRYGARRIRRNTLARASIHDETLPAR